MYYYIMGSASKKSAVWQEKVKNILGDLGIAGETVTPSPARTVEELTTLGIVKGYSTIVAVGSESIANKVATAIIGQKENNDVVLGFIPENYDTPLARKIHLKDVKDACETLKFRKLETIDACFIEPNKYFLTQAGIIAAKPADAYLITSDIQAGLVFSSIIIKPGLNIEVNDDTAPASKKGLLSFLFKAKEDRGIYRSLFHAKRFSLETPQNNFPIIADQEIIAKTPCIFQNRPKVLKIIIARDIINTKE